MPTAVARAAARADAWLALTRDDPGSPPPEDSSGTAPDLLEGARRDGESFDFIRALLEALAGANDPFGAALGLRAAAQASPPSMPARDRLALRAGGIASLGLPWAVLPIARRRLRERVAHLVLAAKLPRDDGPAPVALREELRKRRELGFDALLALGGRPVVGPAGAARELDRLLRLVRDPEVTHLAVDPARLAPETATGTGYWSLDRDAERLAVALRTLLEAAVEHDTAVVIEASDFRGALLGPEALLGALGGLGGLGALDAPDAADGAGTVGDPDAAGAEAAAARFPRARVGISLPAELPESGPVLDRLIACSRARVAAGGEPLEVTIGAAGLHGRAVIESLRSGLAVPTLESGDEVTAQTLRLATAALAAEPAVRVVLASEDPLLLAHLTLIAEHRGAGAHGMRDAAVPALQLRAGVATPLATSLVEHGYRVRVRVPLVPPKEFAGAIDGLIGLAAEAADPESALGQPAVRGRAETDPDPGRDSNTDLDPNTDLDTASGSASGLAIDPASGAGTAQASPTERLAAAILLARQPFPLSHRTRLRRREWDAEDDDPALFYRPPADDERFDTGGLTAAVLGLGHDDTGRIVVEANGPLRRIPVVSEAGFACEPDTDAVSRENREWARDALARAVRLRAAWAGEARAGTPAAHASGADRGPAADGSLAEAWRTQRATERATRIGRLALATASARDRLLALLVAERGSPVALLDAEISGVVDAARYFGLLAPGLGALRGAEFHADRTVLVAADAHASFAEWAEAVLAALAAGSAVVLVVEPAAARSAAALIEEWAAAGLPDGLIELVEAPAEAQRGRAAELAVSRQVDRAMLFGDRELVRAITRLRPDLAIEGRLLVPGSTLIAPSAEPAAAVRAAVRSAFGGTAARAARVLVVLGGSGHVKRVHRLLADAVRGLRPGDTGAEGGDAGSDRDPLSFDLGPLAAAPDAAGLRALTRLEAGEEWLVPPEQLDEAGLLWRPGVRIGLRRDASFWRDAIGMPVIGVIRAGSVAEAIELQNRLGGGSVAALHAIDPSETMPWLDGVRAASLSIGRATSDARIERQPSGGWGAAALGGQPLAGGPNRLVALGSWRLREGTPSSTLHLRGLDAAVRTLIETAQASLDYASFDRLRRAALADALTWRTSLGRVRDEIGMGVERNALRHWPVAVHVRLAESGTLAELLRVLVAGFIVGAPLSVSTGAVLPPEITRLLEEQGVSVSLERDEGWLERLALIGVERAGLGFDAGDLGSERVRLIGGDAQRAAEWLGGQDRLSLWAAPVTMAGPVELLAFLREQAISIAAHRYGFAIAPAGVDERLAELDAAATPPAAPAA